MTARLYHFPRKRVITYDSRLEDASNLLADLADALAYDRLTTLERITWIERCKDLSDQLCPKIPITE
jgi:hypothetical protein